MVRLALFVTIASAASALASFVSRTDPQSIASKRAEAIKRLTPSIRSTLEENEKRAASPGVKNITFSNPTAAQFYVNGANFPEVDFDFGPSWAGLLPISGDADETRKLFFWFFPPGPQGSTDDLIFWRVTGILFLFTLLIAISVGQMAAQDARLSRAPSKRTVYVSHKIRHASTDIPNSP
jgi:hypothetical protein